MHRNRRTLNKPRRRSREDALVVLRTALLLTFLAVPLGAQVELDPPTEEFPPTTEDLNGVAAAPSGEVIVVGNEATVLRRTLDPDGAPIWTPLDAWSAGFFTAEIFTVAHSPVAYANGEGWVVGGRDAVVETDFTTTLVVDQQLGSGKIFTPVLATSQEIWYGVPNLGAFPSFLHRFDRATQTAPGIAFPLGPVLAMCQVPDGNLRYVTTDGDIAEIDDLLQVTTLYDQDDGDPLGLNAASFSDDCDVIAGGDTSNESRIYAGFISALPLRPGPPQSPWRFVRRNGEPAVNSTCFLTPREQGDIKTFFAVMLRCEDDLVETGDEATMEAFSNFLNSRLGGIDTYNEDEKCQRGGTIIPFNGSNPGRSGGQTVMTDFEILTVGIDGRVQSVRGTLPLFSDGFEGGDFGAWSNVVP